MAEMPIQGCVDGDFVVHLVSIDSEDPMNVVADKIAFHSINRRVAPQNKPLRVRFNGQLLSPDSTPASVGVLPLDCLEAFYGDEP